jgi:hypothetical protein
MAVAFLTDSRMTLRATDGPRRIIDRVAARICARNLLLMLIETPFRQDGTAIASQSWLPSLRQPYGSRFRIARA